LTTRPVGDIRRVTRILVWGMSWFALFWLWLLLAGEWNSEEWVAAAAAATLGASIFEVARTRLGWRSRIPARALADVPAVILAVFVDFGIVVWALLAGALRGEIVRGEFRSRELARSGDALDAGTRAWTALAASYSPNAYVVDIDRESHTVLLHDLVPLAYSEEPA
jgi:hypothetical protein